MCAAPSRFLIEPSSRTQTVMSTQISRVPRGVQTGGQFAATAHHESDVRLGRHAAAAEPVRHVPASLRMAHFQDPNLVHNLDRAVRLAGQTPNYGYPREAFGDALNNLDYETADDFFNRAVGAEGTPGYQAVLEEAAAADTAAHPGGALTGTYRPPLSAHGQGYGQGTLSTGSKYTGYRDATEIAKDVRTEIKAATASNYLPAGLKYSVRNDKYTGGQSINVDIQGVSDEDRLDPTELDHRGNLAERAEAKDLRRRVEAIANMFNRQDVDSQSDYFNVMYYSHVQVEDDRCRQFRETEAARRRAKRTSRAA